MDLGLTNKVAIVAAASKGLGKAIAMELAAEGARVAICSRDEKRIREAAESIARQTGAQVHASATDVTKAEDIERFVGETVRRFGTVQILVTNAGGPPPGPFTDLADAEWVRAFELNLMSTIRLCRQVLPLMQKDRWGRIINVTSVAVKQPVDGLMLSNSIRSGVIGFAKTLANEVAAHNILVNNVCPGYIRTERVEDLSRTMAQRKGTTAEAIVKSWEAGIPLGRIGDPREFAALVAFLASERASYITGATIQVDGGMVKGTL